MPDVHLSKDGTSPKQPSSRVPHPRQEEAMKAQPENENVLSALGLEPEPALG